MTQKKNAKANYEQVKTWQRENPDLYKAQKQRERGVKWMKLKEELECSHQTEVLPFINFDCDEAIESEQQQQDLEYLVPDFDLSLLDV